MSRYSWDLDCREEQREGERDYRWYRHADYERNRYEERDRCYFEGYDAAERRAREAREEERAREAAEQRAWEQRQQEAAYEQAMYEEAMPGPKGDDGPEEG